MGKKTDRQGALKTFGEPSHSERRAGMVREVEILGKLKGAPEIPKVLDHNISAAEEKPFVVLEWIDRITVPEHFTSPVSIDESNEFALEL
jgi:serine/threonine protein kinase